MEGLACRQGQRVVVARDLINTRRRRELDAAAAKLTDETGLAHRLFGDGEYMTETFRQRVAFASGCFVMIDDGLGFQLVPWRPALDQYLGQHVSGITVPSGMSNGVMGANLTWVPDTSVFQIRARS